MQVNPEDIDALNDSIADWNKGNVGDIKKEIAKLGIKHYARSPNKIALARALTSKLSKKVDIINRIAYKFPRSAVFLHKGVSRGHPISNPREAKEWFNPVIDNNIDVLDNRVADGQGNLIVNNLNIK